MADNTTVSNASTQSNPAIPVRSTESGGYQIQHVRSDEYMPSDIESGGATEYFGFIDADGRWYIMKKTSTAIRYTAGGASYSTNWTNRAALSYDYWDAVF